MFIKSRSKLLKATVQLQINPNLNSWRGLIFLFYAPLRQSRQTLKELSNTMLSSYRVTIAPLQFLYRIGLLFLGLLLEKIFFGKIFVTVRSWNVPILKMIRRVSDSYDSLQKPNGNTSGTITGYDFDFKWKQKTFF